MCTLTYLRKEAVSSEVPGLFNWRPSGEFGLAFNHRFNHLPNERPIKGPMRSNQLLTDILTFQVYIYNFVTITNPPLDINPTGEALSVPCMSQLLSSSPHLYSSRISI
jgi:hypothetical protein